MSRETLSVNEFPFNPRRVAQHQLDGMLSMHPRSQSSLASSYVEEFMKELHGVSDRNLLSALSVNYISLFSVGRNYPLEQHAAVNQYLMTLAKVRDFNPTLVAHLYSQDTKDTKKTESIFGKSKIIAHVYTDQRIEPNIFMETANIGYDTEQLINLCYEDIGTSGKYSEYLYDEALSKYSEYYESLGSILQSSGIDNRKFK